jgi:hypothetical protein
LLTFDDYNYSNITDQVSQAADKFKQELEVQKVVRVIKEDQPEEIIDQPDFSPRKDEVTKRRKNDISIPRERRKNVLIRASSVVKVEESEEEEEND